MGIFDNISSNIKAVLEKPKTVSDKSLLAPTTEEQLKAIDDKYDNKFKAAEVNVPDALKLEQLEAKSKTDEEIAAIAESSLSDYKSGSIDKINADTEDVKALLETSKENNKLALEEKAVQVEKAYEQAKENTSNDILKRGLGRSSIAVNTVNGYNNAMAEERIKLENSYTDAINKIDNEIAGLDVKREEALRAFDISYAAKLALQISDLKAEREKKEEEIIKYNNTVIEKENQSVLDRLKTISELTGESYSNLVKEYEAYTKIQEGLSEERLQAKYDILFEKLNNMSKKDALKALESDPIYKEHLSDEYYEKLRMYMLIRS